MIEKAIKYCEDEINKNQELLKDEGRLGTLFGVLEAANYIKGLKIENRAFELCLDRIQLFKDQGADEIIEKLRSEITTEIGLAELLSPQEWSTTGVVLKVRKIVQVIMRLEGKK